MSSAGNEVIENEPQIMRMIWAVANNPIRTDALICMVVQIEKTIRKTADFEIRVGFLVMGTPWVDGHKNAQRILRIGEAYSCRW